jgi:hypothetical protein
MNLLVNGNFQTGTFAGWTTSGSPTISSAGYPSEPPPNYAANVTSGIIRQTVSVSGSTTYYFSFWAQATSGNIAFTVQGIPSNNLYLSPTYPLLTTWRYDSFSFTTLPSDTGVRLTMGGIGAVNSLVDDVWLATSPTCYPGDTLIRCINNQTKLIENVRADSITSTSHRVVNTKGETVYVVKNVVSGPTERLVTFPKDVFSPGVPSQDLRLTRGHKLFIDGEEVRAGDHPKGVYGRCEPTLVYSIVCPTREYIYANDQPVVASGLYEWNCIEERVSHTTTSKMLTFPMTQTDHVSDNDHQ